MIGLPGTAFPEKLFERVFKKKYLASSFLFFLHDVAVMLRAIVRDHLQPLALNLPGTAFPEKLFQAFNAMLHFEKKQEMDT